MTTPDDPLHGCKIVRDAKSVAFDLPPEGDPRRAVQVDVITVIDAMRLIQYFGTLHLDIPQDENLTDPGRVVERLDRCFAAWNMGWPKQALEALKKR